MPDVILASTIPAGRNFKADHADALDLDDALIVTPRTIDRHSLRGIRHVYVLPLTSTVPGYGQALALLRFALRKSGRPAVLREWTAHMDARKPWEAI